MLMPTPDARMVASASTRMGVELSDRGPERVKGFIDWICQQVPDYSGRDVVIAWSRAITRGTAGLAASQLSARIYSETGRAVPVFLGRVDEDGVLHFQGRCVEGDMVGKIVNAIREEFKLRIAGAFGTGGAFSARPDQMPLLEARITAIAGGAEVTQTSLSEWSPPDMN